MSFVKAEKVQLKARIGLIGPAGGGKTYTALRLAHTLAQEGKIAVIDTEHGAAKKYAGEEYEPGKFFDFDVMELESFHPQRYIDGLKEAAREGYAVVIIDSLSHAWIGKDGELELNDRASKKYHGNTYVSWRDVTPIHNNLIDTMLSSPLHVIATLRSKMDYIQTKEGDKTVIKKVGMAPQMKDGMEYEFDFAGDFDLDHNWMITKTRCNKLDGAVINRPGEQVANIILEWLNAGEPVKETNLADAATAGAKNTASTAPPVGRKASKSAPAPTGKKLSREDVVSLYSLVDASGATTEIFNCIFDREVPNRRLDNGKINWNAVDIPEFERLKILFKTPERWQKVYREIMEFEELAEGIDLDELPDAPGEQQAG